jgi:ATP-dependent Clp protease ATP-binding subunit ClpA
MERHSVSRLIGAPPGYVGFDQGGLLTEAVLKKPHSVLLLDEIEKAHPDMQNILLQVMDHGKLTDNNGRQADFRNTVIIMTTNAGAAELARTAIGFQRGTVGAEKGLPKAIRDMFSPEFRNRLNSIIMFGPLDQKIVKQVAARFIADLNTLLKAKKVAITVTDEALAWIAKNGYDPAYGARPIKRLIEDKVKQPMADELIHGKLQKGGQVTIGVKDDKLDFTFASRK